MSKTRLVGGTRLVGRNYLLAGRPVVVVVGWGPGASMRNVRIRFLDDGTELVRPFRGLRLSVSRSEPSTPPASAADSSARSR